MVNSGFFYLQSFDPATKKYQESSDFFSFSKFVNPSAKPKSMLYTSPNEAFQNGELTSGQATGIGLPVITTGTGPGQVTQILSGPSYTYPFFTSGTFDSKLGCINGISYIRVALTDIVGGTLAVTGYWIAIDANPLPGSCE